ncbi:MAG: UDP-glucose 4-epimerase GalE [Desulfobacteraceae bacterium]
MRILVVGGAGYIGSHMVKALLEADFDVFVLDNLSTGYRELLAGGTLVQGCMGDRNLLDNLFQSTPIDAVMHFAAFSLVGESVQNPLKYYRNNISETLSLIEAMVRHRVERFIFSSTAAVYGEPVRTPISEDHPLVPTNPYGTSKLCVERILEDCDQAHGLRSISLRYFNAAGADASGAIGEMHNPETHLIPLVLESALSQKPVKIFGTDYPTPDGTCIRDYVHVTDLAQAHLLALRALLDGAGCCAYNLGNSIGYAVRQVIDVARKVTGRKIQALEEQRRAGDPAILVADSEKIKGALNWAPEYEDLESIIATAWKWIKTKC